MNDHSILKALYFRVISFAAIAVQMKLRGGLRFRIVDGRPFLIANDWPAIAHQEWVKKLTKMLAAVPYLAPLSLVTPEEFQNLHVSFQKTAENFFLEYQKRNSGTASPAAKTNVEALPPPYCQIAFNELHVTCEGDAYMCCWQPRPQASIGNVLHSSIEKVWNSEFAKETRASILRGEFPKPCQEAAGCPYVFHNHRPGHAIAKSSRYLMIDINLPNTHCNIGGHKPTESKPACIMCQRSHKDYLFQDDSEFDKVLEKIRQSMPTVERLHIQGIAEPFWKDEIFRVMDKIGFDEHSSSVHLSTTTNGTVFTPERQALLFKRCPHLQVNFSIDASTEETYRKIRRLDAFETVLNNVRHFGELRKNYPGTIFRIQNNINLLNIDDVVGMVQFAAEVQADALELNPTEGDFDFVVNDRTAPLFAETERKAFAEARKLGIRLETQRPLDMGYLSRQSGQAPSPPTFD